MHLCHEHGHPHSQHGQHLETPALSLAELAELAASSSVTGWASLFAPVLSAVFQHILGSHDSPRELLGAWQPLALVCKAWHSALLATPLGLEIKTDAHISDAALRWMSRAQVEFLLLPRSLDPLGADRRLLEGPEFRRNSARCLRSLVNCGPTCLPLLHAFTNLQQVTIFEQAAEDGVSSPSLLGLGSMDLALLRQLPKLHCLTIAGHYSSLSTSQLPGKLRHLTLSCYSEGGGIDLELPAGLEGPLEFLDCKADYVLLDWSDVCHRCQDVSICGDTVMMKVGQDSINPAQVLQDPQLALYHRFGACISQGEEVEQVMLAFFHLALYSGDRDLGASLIDADDFLEALRGDLLGSYDVDPAFESYPLFVRDRPAEHPCFVLSVQWQGEEGPRSFHFTTPITQSEHQLLLAHPVWQLAWCRDPLVNQVLSDPAFIARSGPTLANLTNIPLWPGANLLPFTALKVVMLLAPDTAADAEAAALAPGGGPDAGDTVAAIAEAGEVGLAGLLGSVQLPPCLESLCLSAEGVQTPQDFSADCLPQLPKLQEFGLFNYRRHDLRRLPPSVTCVRIMNPRLEEGEAVGGASFTFPDWPAGSLGAGGSSRGAGGQSEPKAGKASSTGVDEGVSSLGLDRLALSRSSSGVSFESAHSSMSPGGEELVWGSPNSSTGPGASTSGSQMGSAADRPEPGSSSTQGSGMADRRASNAVASPPAGDENAGEASSNGIDGGMRRAPNHHHHHHHLDGRGHGGKEGNEAGRGQACTDPHCPLHSGKRFLQLSFTDQRQRAAVDLCSLLGSGAHMISLACDTSQPTVLELRHEGALADLVQRLDAAGVDTLELTCDPSCTYFAGEGGGGRSTLLAGLLSAVAPALQAGGGSGRVPLLQGLRRLAAAGAGAGGRWEVKSFDGEAIHEGVVDTAKSWALLRRATQPTASSAQD